jgi:hypothetical protein
MIGIPTAIRIAYSKSPSHWSAQVALTWILNLLEAWLVQANIHLNAYLQKIRRPDFPFRR